MKRVKPGGLPEAAGHESEDDQTYEGEEDGVEIRVVHIGAILLLAPALRPKGCGGGRIARTAPDESRRVRVRQERKEMVDRGRIELPTHGFSGRCSTN